MVEPEHVFVTVAFEYTPARPSVAGFFCLWDEELTFVRSAWIRFVTSLTGIVLGNVRPAGPDDARTRTRVAYADIAEAALHNKRKKWIRVRTHDGQDRFFGGGQLNRGFNFPQVSDEIAKALSAAGYRVSQSTDVLTVGGVEGERWLASGGGG
jgi:hypothetical protein